MGLGAGIRIGLVLPVIIAVGGIRERSLGEIYGVSTKREGLDWGDARHGCDGGNFPPDLIYNRRDSQDISGGTPGPDAEST
jgi:hypothetical protein